MANKFEEPIAALRTYAITRRREAEKKREEASLLLRGVDEILQDAKDFDMAADALAGPKTLTPEEQARLDEVVKAISESAVRAVGRIFPHGFDFKPGAGGRVRR